MRNLLADYVAGRAGAEIRQDQLSIGRENNRATGRADSDVVSGVLERDRRLKRGAVVRCEIDRVLSQRTSPLSRGDGEAGRVASRDRALDVDRPSRGVHSRANARAVLK